MDFAARLYEYCVAAARYLTRVCSRGGESVTLSGLSKLADHDKPVLKTSGPYRRGMHHAVSALMLKGLRYQTRTASTTIIHHNKAESPQRKFFMGVLL